jgi:hypothetical protein
MPRQLTLRQFLYISFDDNYLMFAFSNDKNKPRRFGTSALGRPHDSGSRRRRDGVRGLKFRAANLAAMGQTGARSVRLLVCVECSLEGLLCFNPYHREL